MCVCVCVQKLNIKGQSEHVTFLDVDITIEDDIFAYLYISFLTKETSFLSLLWVCFSVKQYSIINIL